MMSHSSWKKVPIKELYSGFWDGLHATPKEAHSGPIYLGIKNISEDGHLDFSDIRHITEEDYSKWIKRVEPKAGDIVFTYEATLHRYAIIPEGFRGCLGRRLALIRTNPEVVETKFLYYYFFGEEWRSTVSKYIMLGATVDRIPIIHFPKFEVNLPPLPIQRQIADVLSAYDDLIEVNTRRIRILEQMARSVYREWFGKVDEKSLPEGWEKAKVADAFEIVGGSTPSTKVPEYWAGGDINWYSPSDLTANKAMFISSSGKKITQEGFKNSSAKMFPPYCVMMTSRATIGVISINTTTACTNQGFITCIPNDRVSVYQIYFWILDNLELIDNVASGATYKEIGRGEFREFDFVIGDKPTNQRFDEIMSPIGRQIEVLLAKNANLRRTRDLLLPRLVSGEVGS